MIPIIRLKLALAVLAGALMCAAALSSCGVKTYVMVDPGKPSDAFNAFYRAVSDGDDEAANRLLSNYRWHSYMPDRSGGDHEYSVNGSVLTGSDAKIMDCVLKSRKCVVVSESDCTGDDMIAWVTVSYTSFDITKFQKELAARAVEEVKNRRYNGEVLNDSSDTQPIIENIKNKLLREPADFYTTRRYKICLASVKGKWKVIMTEDFYKALSGYTE